MLVRRGHGSPFKSIIACVDFSDDSIRAAFKAGELATLERASLNLVYVYKPVIQYGEVYAWAATSAADDLDSDVIQHLEEKLDEISKQVQIKYPDIEITTKVKICMSVSNGVNQQIDEFNADLVVLNTRGRTGASVFSLGTTAERIIHDSQCSVYTIKPEGFEYGL
jgi:nucleotide-binding universal stress UspA family protein